MDEQSRANRIVTMQFTIDELEAIQIAVFSEECAYRDRFGDEVDAKAHAMLLTLSRIDGKIEAALEKEGL